jgi:hypothetical protein
MVITRRRSFAKGLVHFYKTRPKLDNILIINIHILDLPFLYFIKVYVVCLRLRIHKTKHIIILLNLFNLLEKICVIYS